MEESYPDDSSPWHEGERSIRRRVGVEAALEAAGPRVIVSRLPRQHVLFLAQLPYLVLGTVDRSGNPWATLLVGEPGFLVAPNPGELRINGALDVSDPAAAGCEAGMAIGALGIDLATRRRARLNGVLTRVLSDHALLSIRQAFGNCPQYIVARSADYSPNNAIAETRVVTDAEGLDEPARDLIAAADTFFVASYTDRQDGDVRAVDASHRGGKPGFVRVQGDRLTIPDFRGNRYFNTLGNFVHMPRAGLAFVDFGTGDVLQLTGDVTLDFEGHEADEFAGAERLWHVQVRRCVLRRRALALQFGRGEASRQSLATGEWPDPRGSIAVPEP